MAWHVGRVQANPKYEAQSSHGSAQSLKCKCPIRVRTLISLHVSSCMSSPDGSSTSLAERRRPTASPRRRVKSTDVRLPDSTPSLAFQMPMRLFRLYDGQGRQEGQKWLHRVARTDANTDTTDTNNTHTNTQNTTNTPQIARQVPIWPQHDATTSRYSPSHAMPT